MTTLPLTGSFLNPFPANPWDEANPQPETIVYELYLDRCEGPIQYYTAHLGSGQMVENKPHFDYIIKFVFTWNPEANLSEIKAGRVCWMDVPGEKLESPQNLEGGIDENGNIACFECKRYDEYISVRRTMNAILGNTTTRLVLSEFTEEERAIYHADAWRREERAFNRALQGITLPKDLTDAEKTDWLMKNHYDVWLLRDRLETTFLYSQSTEGRRVGDHYFALDATLYGPYANKEAMDAALEHMKSACVLAAPCRAYITEKGEWRGCSEDEVL
jgi:hypothetical protein